MMQFEWRGCLVCFEEEMLYFMQQLKCLKQQFRKQELTNSEITLWATSNQNQGMKWCITTVIPSKIKIVETHGLFPCDAVQHLTINTVQRLPN